MELADLIVIWALIFARLSMMMVFVPVLGSRNAPMSLRVALISIMSLMFMMTGAFNYDFLPAQDVQILKAIVFEMINGMTIGFGITIIMNAIYIAGHLIDMNIGFSMVNVMSAQDDNSVPITANFYYTFMLIIFVAINAHHMVIDAFALSLDKLPLGALGFNVSHLASFNELIGLTFDIGFRIAMPITLTIMVTNVILGLLSKAMPGMNVFMVGMPFKILVGLMTLALVFPVTYDILKDMLDIMGDFIYAIVGRMYL